MLLLCVFLECFEGWPYLTHESAFHTACAQLCVLWYVCCVVLSSLPLCQCVRLCVCLCVCFCACLSAPQPSPRTRPSSRPSSSPIKLYIRYMLLLFPCNAWERQTCRNRDTERGREKGRQMQACNYQTRQPQTCPGQASHTIFAQSTPTLSTALIQGGAVGAGRAVGAGGGGRLCERRGHFLTRNRI